VIVLTNVWVRRFCPQVPSGQYLIPISETALHGSNEFELASSRVSPGGPKPRRDHGVHERPSGPCFEFDSPPSPPGTRFRRPRLKKSLGRLVYWGNSTALAGGGYFKDWPESRLGPDGHYGLLLDGINADGVQHRHKQLAPFGQVRFRRWYYPHIRQPRLS